MDDLADELSYRMVMRKACASLVQATSTLDSTPTPQARDINSLSLVDSPFLGSFGSVLKERKREREGFLGNARDKRYRRISV